MSTLHTTVLDYLKGRTEITGTPCDARIYVDTWLPDDYKIEDGPCLVFAPRGGPGTNFYEVANATFIFRAFAKLQSDAWLIDGGLFDALKRTHNPANATAFYAKDTTAPTLDRDPGGLYVVSSGFAVAECL